MVVILDCFVYEHKFLLNIKWARLVAILKKPFKKGTPSTNPNWNMFGIRASIVLDFTSIVFRCDDLKEGDHLNTKHMVVWYSDHEMNN